MMSARCARSGSRLLPFRRLRSAIALAAACTAVAIAFVCPASAVPENLCGNPSFEAGTAGWKVYNGASIARVAGGAEGVYALEVHGASDLTTFGINDSPNWITTVEGVAVRYRFSAKVRSTASHGSARLQIREYDDGTQRGATVKTTPVPLSTSWQTVTGDYVVTTANSTLDFQVLDIPVAGNETFLIDDVSIIVVVPDRAPVVTVEPGATVEEGETLGMLVTATDPDGDPITSLAADLSGLPSASHASFTQDGSNASGMFNWSPTYDDAGGPYVVRFFAGNVLAGVASTEIEVTNVDRAPVVTAPSMVATQDSAMITVEVSVADFDGDPIGELIVDAGELPPGNDAVFEVNADHTAGTFTWTPALGASGDFPIRFVATNDLADTAVTVLSVSRLEHPPTIVVASSLEVSEGEEIELGVSAFDPDGDPFTSLSADLSAFPTGAGVTFTTSPDQTSGVLRWLPGYDDAGSYAVVFTADNGEAASAWLEVEVRNVDRIPVVIAPDVVTAFEGEPLTLEIAAADPDGEPLDLLSGDLAGLPAGNDAAFAVSTDQSAGTLAWTPGPGERGTYTVTFRAANSLIGSADVTVLVRAPNQAPAATLVVSPELTATPMLVTASAAGSSDPEGDPLTYRFDFGDGIVVGPQSSPIASAILSTPGIDDITVIATDAFGARDTATARVRAHLGNLCTNPGIENTTVGWGAYGASTIARVAGAGRGGSYAFEATKASGSGWGFNDVPDWVPVTAGTGRTYRYLAWVRSVADHGQVSVRVQEFLGTAQKGITRVSPAVTVGDAWQLVSVDYVVTTPGTRLDMKILYNGTGVNEKFLIDDVQVLLLPVGDQPPLVMAPATVTAIAGQPLAITVRAADPDGQPIGSIAADLRSLPPGNDASFAIAPGGADGVIAWTPRASDVGPVPYTVTITAANGLSTTVPIEIVVSNAPLANLCANPGFETNAAGWSPYVSGTTITRVNSARTGRFGVQLAHPSDTGWGLNDQLDIVSAVAGPGRTYRFSAWVRSTTSAGKVRMRVQEFLGATQKGVTVESPEMTLTNQWRQLTASYTATTAGTRLDMKILDAPVALGESFLVDDVEVLLLPAGDRPPVMSAPEAITATKQQPMTVTVAVADPDGDAITTLAADLSGLPANANAAFTPGARNGTGILSWTPGAGDARAAPYVVTFTAGNAKNAVASTAITVTGTTYPNLCANPGFESNLIGWGTYGAATIARAAGGHSGGWAMRMTTTGASSFGADDVPNVVANVAAAGDRYRFGAWVRSDSSTSPARLRVYEFQGGVQLGPVTYSYEVPASRTWQLVTVDHTALAAGSTLSLRVTMSPAAAAQKFLVDDVTVQQLPPGAALVAGSPLETSETSAIAARGPRAVVGDPHVGAGDLVVRLEGVDPLLEGGLPDVTMRLGAHEVAAAIASIGGDADGDGCEELEVRFTAEALRALLADRDPGNLQVTVSARRGDEAVEIPLALEWSGEGLAFAASFAPNPMRGQGTLTFALPEAGPVRVELFDLAGRRVRTLLDEAHVKAGRHTIAVSSHAPRLAAGVYFYRVDAMPNGLRSGRVVVLE
jgi:hypothetical protein